jgi:hypothetical protein
MAPPARRPRNDNLPVRAGLLALAGAALFVAVKRQGGPGSALKRLAAALGAKPCADCQRRAAAMDRWFASPSFPRGGPRTKR